MNMLEYFHHDKGDVTRHSEFESLCIKHPHLKIAYDNMINYTKIFEIVISQINEEEE